MVSIFFLAIFKKKTCGVGLDWPTYNYRAIDLAPNMLQRFFNFLNKWIMLSWLQWDIKNIEFIGLV